jgi:hypothetical protein
MLLRLDPAAHPRAAQATSGITQRFERGMDERKTKNELISGVGGGLDTHERLPLPAPTSAPWEWGKSVGLSL